MLRNFFSDEPTDVDDLIDTVQLKIQDLSPDSKEYTAQLGHLTKLYEIKAASSRKPVSSDTMFIVGGNFVLALALFGFERTHMTVSKAFNMFHRPKGL